MLKNFLFTALLLNMIASYLSFTEMKRNSSRQPFLFMIIGIVFLVIMAGLTVDLFFNSTPILFNTPALLWVLLILSFVLEIVSLIKKILPGQLIAASILLFLVMPTILSIGIYLLVIVIAELIVAFIIFQKTRDLGFK